MGRERERGGALERERSDGEREREEREREESVADRVEPRPPPLIHRPEHHNVFFGATPCEARETLELSPDHHHSFTDRNIIMFSSGRHLAKLARHLSGTTRITLVGASSLPGVSAGAVLGALEKNTAATATLLLPHRSSFCFSSSLPEEIENVSEERSGGERKKERSQEIEIKGLKLKGRPLYLDGAATTRVDPRVLDAM